MDKPAAAAIANVLVKQNKVNEAIQYLKESIKQTEKTGNTKQMEKSLLSLSEAYSASGDYEEAQESYKKYVKLADSLLIEKENQLNAKFDLISKLNSKQQEIEFLVKQKDLDDNKINLLEEKHHINQQIIIVLIIVFCLLITGLYFVIKNTKAKRRANQLLALKALRTQMNPHFIFNSLNSVNNFISKNDERSANKYLSDFARLMRMVMENSKFDFVSLSSEIKIIDIYLKLEHSRFKDKFDYNFSISKTIDVENIRIPPMLLQPFIENAIWHGLRYNHEKGFLNVEIFNENKGIKIIICDNGIGRKKSVEIKTKNQKENVSTGLKNIENRIQILNKVHNTKIDVNIEDYESDSDNPGTKVTLKIL